MTFSCINMVTYQIEKNNKPTIYILGKNYCVFFPLKCCCNKIYGIRAGNTAHIPIPELNQIPNIISINMTIQCNRYCICLVYWLATGQSPCTVQPWIRSTANLRGISRYPRSISNSTVIIDFI